MIIQTFLSFSQKEMSFFLTTKKKCSTFYPNKISLHFGGIGMIIMGTELSIHCPWKQPVFLQYSPNAIIRAFTKTRLLMVVTKSLSRRNQKISSSGGALYTMSTLGLKTQFYPSVRPMLITSLFKGSFKNSVIESCPIVHGLT